MAMRDWMVGGCAATLAVAATLGVMRRGSADGAPPPEAPQLAADREQVARLKAALEREQALAVKEQAVTSREEALASQEKILAEQAKAVPPKAPGEDDASGGILKLLMSQLQDPVQLEIQKDQARSQAAMTYAALLETWELGEEARGALIEALAAHQLQGAEWMRLMLDPKMNDEEIVRCHDETEAAYRVELSRHLSNLQIEELQAFDQELAGQARQTEAESVAQDLAPMRLSDPVRDRIRDILLDDQERTREPFKGGMTVSSVHAFRKDCLAAFSSADGMLGQKKAEKARIQARVVPLLTPEQARAWQEKDAQELKMIEASLQFLNSMEGK